MKYLSLIILATLTLLSCKKDNKIEQYDCESEDRSQRMFEHWDDATKEKIAFTGANVKVYPDTETTGTPAYISLSADELKHNGSIEFAFVPTVRQYCYFALSYKGSQFPMFSGSVSPDAAVPGDTFRVHVDNYEAWRSGCARLHYAFVDSMGTAVTKGHFTVAISQ